MKTATRRIATAAITAVFVVVSTITLTASPASAADNGLWSVDPGGGNAPGSRPHFNYTLKPDQIFRDTVTVANLSDDEMTFDLYPTDAYNTSLDAGFALLEADEEPIDVGTWIELATDQITLEPGTQADIPFRIAIPLDARPGDHAGAIVAQNVEAEGQIDADGVGIDVNRRVGSRVYVRVDGPLKPDLEVTRVATQHSSALLPPFTGKGEATLGYEIKNTGNTRITPTADLTVKGILGGTVIDFDERELNELLPGSSIVITEGFEGVPALNRLSAKVTVTGVNELGDDTIEATGSKAFWVVSWMFVVDLLLIPVLFVLWRRVRRKNAELEDDQPPPPPARQRELVDA